MINFQRPTFPDLTNFCYKNFVYEAIILFQIKGEVNIVTAVETQEQVKKTTYLNNSTHKFYPR